MSAPFLLLLATSSIALSVTMVRNRPKFSAAIAAVGSALIAMFAMLVTLDEPLVVLGLPIKVTSVWRILGRALILDERSRVAIGFLYLTGAFVFGAAWATKASRNLYYIGLLSLGSIAASFMIQPFLYAAIFLEFTAMGAVLILVSPGYQVSRGGLRLLILYTLAMMAILLAGWMLENVGVTSATPELAQRATLLLAIGFSVIMAVPPFHLWLPSAAGETNPYALAFVTVILQNAGLFFLLRFLDNYAWLRAMPELYDGIRVVGIAMVLFGSFLVLAQKSFTKVMAYALLTDFGVMLLAVGAGTPEGCRLALGLSAVRVVSLSVWALGLAWMLEHPAEDHLQLLRGAAHNSPLAATATLVGVMSIAGFPLTAGFPGRWGLLLSLAPLYPLAGGSILLALLCVGMTAIRWTYTLLSEPRLRERKAITFSERIFLGGGIGMCLMLGTFPQVLYPWIVEVAACLTQLFP